MAVAAVTTSVATGGVHPPFPRRLGETPPTPAGAPRIGEHTDEVLSSVLDLSSAELDTLRADGII